MIPVLTKCLMAATTTMIVVLVKCPIFESIPIENITSPIGVNARIKEIYNYE